MLVHEIVGGEGHPIYEALAAENLDRQYNFLRSIVNTTLALNRPMLSLAVIKALNFHGIAILHPYAGEFRPCRVVVGNGPDAYEPPQYFLVPSLMEMFVDEVNRRWDSIDPVLLCAYVLWKLNHIHPFVNGNGRAARASAYYVLCLKLGGFPKGDPILPALIKANRDEYVAALKVADASLRAGALDLTVLHAYIVRLLEQQKGSEKAAAASGPNPIFVNPPIIGDENGAAPG